VKDIQLASDSLLVARNATTSSSNGGSMCGCDRVRASFNAPMPQLQPLSIMGLGYRWSLDFAGPLPVTPRHNKYVLVMIEHFSKWIELVALLGQVQ
jgi:hypothetical protein